MPLTVPATGDISAPGTVLHTSVAAPRLDFIDALRGWAILAVLFFHSGQYIGTPSLRSLALRGEFGVQLFYVISAATLYLSLHARWGRDGHPLTAYFIRRVARIAPMFWLAIVANVACYGLGPRFWAPEGISSHDILLTFLFAHGWEPGTINSVVMGGWSVGVEMSFYLLMPLLFFFVRNLRQAVGFFLFSLLFGEGISHFYHHWLDRSWPPATGYLVDKFTYFWLPAQLPVFALGGVLYFLCLRAPSAGRFSGRSASLGLLVLAVALSALFFNWDHPLPKQHIGFGLAFLCLAWALALQPWRVLVNPTIRHLGVVSFSAYLIHFFVIKFLAEQVPGFSSWIAAGGNLQLCVLTMVSLLLTTALSTMTYHLVERPGQLLGKQIILALERRFAFAPVAQALPRDA